MVTHDAIGERRDWERLLARGSSPLRALLETTKGREGDVALVGKGRRSVSRACGMGRRRGDDGCRHRIDRSTPSATGEACMEAARSYAENDRIEVGPEYAGWLGRPTESDSRRGKQHRPGRGMRGSGVLIHKSSAYRPCDPQSTEAVRPLRCEGEKAVQVRVPKWFPVQVTNNRRCYILRRRYHHGLIGAKCIIVGTVLRKLELVLLGAALCLHDKEDWPWPMTKQLPR